MAYVKASIKKGKGSPGAPEPKNPNLIIIDVDDVETEPGRNGVLSVGNLVLKTGTKALSIYCTPSTIDNPEESAGDPDKESITDKLSGFKPGINQAIDAFLQEKLGGDFLVITKVCNNKKQTLLHGTICNPLKLQYTKQDNNEGRGYTLNFTQSQPSKYKPLYYLGTDPELAAPAPEEPDDNTSVPAGSAGDGLG